MTSTSWRIDHYVEKLFHKSGSKREDALSSITRILSSRMQTEYVQKNFATLLYRFIYSLKKGSAKERDLASNALGLLAMTIHCKVKAHELYDESTPLLSKALNSSSGTTKELDALAIVTFFGADNSDETEKIMKIMWDNIHLKSGSTAVENSGRKMSLISAWSFLLSTLDGWRISCKCWKGAISHFFRLLEDEVLRVAALEALSVINEIGSVQKFSGDLFVSEDEAVQDVHISIKNNSSKGELAEETCELIRNKILEFNSDALRYLKEDCTKIGKMEVVLSTCAQRVQLKFIKMFLGSEGFKLHMRENELFQDVFDFRIGETNPSCELYESIKEKTTTRCFIPSAKTAQKSEYDMLEYSSSKDKGIEKRMVKSKNAPLSKALTQLRNKQRMQAEERHVGYIMSQD